MSDDPLAIARAQLEPGEELIWADRPAPQGYARTMLPKVIRGVLGLAVVAGLHWYGFVPNWQASLQNALLFAFLVAAGLYCVWLIVTPNLARVTARTMVYAITDRRLMILKFWPLERSHFFALKEIDTPRAMATQTGEGAVIFIERKLPWWQRSAGGSYQIEGFFGIGDAPRVASEIERLKLAIANRAEDD